MRRPLSFLILLTFLTPAVAAAAEIDLKARYRDRAAIVVSNDLVKLTTLPVGGPLASILLREDAEKLNPLWDAMRDDIERGRPVRQNGGLGHFVCVDGFGPVSKEEAAAGVGGHGEAHSLPWETVSARSEGGEAALVQRVYLPRHAETFTRTISLRDGENVVRIHGELVSLLSFDRPANWAEHATIGSPFLEPAVTVVDMSKNRAMTRPRPKSFQRKHRFKRGTEFEWPMAPREEGGTIDLRAAPAETDSLDHTTHLMTPSGGLAWVTALNPKKRLLLGYLFRTSEYPWLQTWEHYPPDGMLARGLEFGTQAFDLPRREVVTANRLFGELLYRWLPALTKIESSYLLFWTRAPEGFLGVSDVRLEAGGLVIRDDRSGKTLTLKTRQTL